jgi:teichuronic acid biosynthesis glycosyltransferase TuaH
MATLPLQSVSGTVRSNGRRRILYLMHVDWRWIKQRPHFLAEALSTEHDVHVLHPLIFRNRSPITRGEVGVPRSPLLPIPWDWKAIRWARWLHWQWVTHIARQFRPDTIWVTHPSLMYFIPERLMELPIIYDCMDDAFTLVCHEHEIPQLKQLEQKLVRCSARILCSSNYLGKTLVDRYARDASEKLFVVRNAVSAKLVAGSLAPWKTKQVGHAAGARCKIAYFGTVAEWLDFDMLLACLSENPNVEFHLIGPAQGESLPSHERLHYHGAVAHDKLREYVAPFDTFLIPFQLIPLIQAVDPVKIYEYLAFGKEVISVQYPEIDRFGDFVHFYKTRSEFIQLVDALAAGKLPLKNCPEVTRPFLEQNTWETRVERISDLLNSLE